MSIAPKFAPLRGTFALRNITRGETVFTPTFDATSGTLTPTVSTEKVKSTGNTPGDIFSYETGRSLTLALTAKSRHLYILEQALLGSSIPRAASTAPVNFVYPVLKAGQLIELPARNILTVSILGKVEGVDFEVLPKSGWVTALLDNITAIDSEDSTFTNGIYDEVGVFSAEAQRFEILFSSEVSGQSYKLYNGLLVPGGAFDLVKETGIGESPISFELSQVTTAVNDAVLGKYGRAFNVA